MKAHSRFNAALLFGAALMAIALAPMRVEAQSACPDGRADCDGDAANGCETQLANSVAHCGACGHACGADLVCDVGACRHDEVRPVMSHRMILRPTGRACITTDTGHTAIQRATVTPVLVANLTDAVQIAAGEEHSCAVRATGRVSCWGIGTAGQLGDGGAEPIQRHPTIVRGLVDAVQVAASVTHTCARRTNGAVVCWGGEQFGQLGRNARGMGPVATPVPVASLVDTVDVAVGGYSSCAVRSTGAVVCWGRNSRGQLGDGTLVDRMSPVAVGGISDALSVSVGAEHSCAVRRGGQVMCWGFNNNGQLGDGTDTDRLTAHPVRGVSDAIAVSAGEYHTCALRSGGDVACWGWNFSGGLGDGGRTTRSLPVVAIGVHHAVQIRAAGNHSCARVAGGQVTCWGANGFGESGNGSLSPLSSAAPVRWLENATDIAVGAGHVCARRANGTVVCWGRGDSGQLGE